MQRVVLTGGAGFVGHHCLEYFLTNTDWHLIVIDSFRHKGTISRLAAIQNYDPGRVTVLKHDLSVPIDSALFNQIIGRTIKSVGMPIDIIISMAADSAVERSVIDPMQCWRNNCDLSINMLEFARQVQPRIFFNIGTDEVYGECTGDPHKEWDVILPSNPYCLPPETEIATTTGLVQIQFFDPLRHSLISRHKNHCGKSVATKKFQRNYDGELLDIECEHGEISVTPEHKLFRKETRYSVVKDPYMFAKNGKPVSRRPHKKIVEVCSKEVQIGDYLCMTRFIPFDASARSIDGRLCRFLGYFVGDGCYNDDTGYIRLADQKREYLEEYRILLKELLGVSSKSNTGAFGCIYDHKTKDCGYLQFASKELRAMIDLSKPKAEIVDYFFSADKESILAFLAGFMDAEAHFRYEGNKLVSVSLPQADFGVLKKLQFLCRKVGLLGKISSYEDDDGHICFRIVITDNHSLQIVCSSISSFKVKKNTEFAKQQHKGWSKKLMWTRVTRINKRKYSGIVYDLEVPVNHNYVANYFVVHNSASKAAQEALAISYWRTFKMPIVLINGMNMIGEAQDKEKFLPKLIWKVVTDQTMEIYGEPGFIGSRFYLHAKNMADALIFLSKRSPATYPQAERPDRYNVVGDMELNNLEVGQMVAGLLEKKLLYKLIPSESARPGYDKKYALDGKKMADLGWTLPIPTKEAFEAIVRWSLANPHWIV